VAAYRRGLAFLHLGDPELVAVRLGVHAFVVVEAKEFLRTPEGRERMLDKVREARDKHPHPLKCPPAWPVVPACPESPHSVRELIRAAEERPEGLAFLTDASPEFVAVTFHVHPDLVFRAREVIQRWKASTDRRGS
jgi:hypothetical protein